MKIPIYAVAAVGILACGDKDYVYTPTSPNTVSAGLPATRTPIPQEQPQGAVEVASYGVAPIKLGDTRVPALHVRMMVTNDGDVTPWRLDTTQQLVEIPGEGRSAPIYASADVDTLPSVQVGQRERRILDLYYPLPSTIRGDAQLPRFELLWQVDTAARTVASRTEFDRAEPASDVESSYDTWALSVGYGPYWWYDTVYPRRVVFVHSRPVVIHDHRRPAAVGRFNGRFRPAPAQIARRPRR